MTKLRTLLFPSKPTALDLAVADLHEAEKDRLAASKHREYYCMAEAMYFERVQRLKSDIAEMMADKEPS
jgi:hypothetical protein